MGAHWGVAERYATLLQRVMDEFMESERVPGGVREMPSTVRILADMRRCAYDLDFLISRQPRQVFGSKQVGATMPGVTTATMPVRTPAVNELEYLDVFDFFNMPRLPAVGESSAGVSAAEGGGGGGGAGTEYQSFVDYQGVGEGAGSGNDWLVQ